jgi:hypothetical protein
MTKKDFELIAAALKQAKTDTADCTDARKWHGGIDTAAACIALALQADNSRFDLDRFLAAAK